MLTSQMYQLNALIYRCAQCLREAYLHKLTCHFTRMSSGPENIVRQRPKATKAKWMELLAKSAQIEVCAMHLSSLIILYEA